jgi:hypothetical protein
MDRLYRFSIARPRTVILLAVALTVVLAGGGVRLKLRTDGRALIPEKASEVPLDRRIREEIDALDRGNDQVHVIGAPVAEALLGSPILEDLGLPDYGDADTIILRSDDPFDRCELPAPAPRTVGIQIVALSFESIEPITVTVAGRPPLASAHWISRRT